MEGWLLLSFLFLFSFSFSLCFSFLILSLPLLLQHSIDEIAEAMTIAEQRMITFLQPSEFFHTSNPLSAPNLTRLAKLFNSVFSSFLFRLFPFFPPPFSFLFFFFFYSLFLNLNLDKLLGWLNNCFERNPCKNH